MEHPQIASLDDIPISVATNAYNWTSHDPSRRGHATRVDYVFVIDRTYAELWPLATTDEQRELLASEMLRFKESYKKAVLAFLHSHARCASPMIAGPANFPVARQRKRSEVADKRRNEMITLAEKAKQAIAKKLNEARSPEQKSEDDWEAARGFIESRWEWKEYVYGMVERLAHNGQADLVTRCLEFIADRQESKPLFTKRHRIWGLDEIATKISALREARAQKDDEVIAQAEGVKAISNFGEDRVQIMFDKRCEQPIYQALKRSGWNWSRANNAWQRKLTENAKYSAKQIVQQFTTSNV